MLRKIIQSPVIKDIFLCLLCALLLIFSFPGFNLWLFAWFGFVPLFFALRNKSKRQAFLLSYLTGVIFWLGVVYWLVHVTAVGMVVLVLYLALYFGLFGLLIRKGPQLLFVPSVWVILEYARSHLLTGFPWAKLAYSQYLNLPVIQIADITGAWGVSFLIMMVNVAVYSGTRYKVQGTSLKQKLKQLVVPLVVVLIVVGYGYYKLYWSPVVGGRALLNIAVIQPDIPQALKWDVKARGFIKDKYFTLTQDAAQNNPDLIIWPEAALPVILEEEPGFFEDTKSFARKINTPLLLGSATVRSGDYYNSALLVSAQGEELGRYDKLHLVPFGEYIPLRGVLPFLETIVPIGDFSRGSEYTIFEIPNPKSLPVRQVGQTQNTFGVLICFEDVFPELARGFARGGAEFLVNITNDGWFGRTSAPYQHFSAAVFRAVENRLPLVRSANTGVSGFIASDGRIISLLQDKAGRNIFIQGYKAEQVGILKNKPSLYTTYGNIFILACLILALCGIIRLPKK